MITAPPENDGDALEGRPGVDLWAKLGVRLESLTAQLERRELRREKLYAALHFVQLTAPPVDAAGATVDRPDLLGPRWGWLWDIRRLTLAPADPASPWTGTVYLYNARPAPVNFIDAFTAPGPLTRWFPKSALLLNPHERLVLVAGPDFTGTAVPGGIATQVKEECLPEYLS